MKMRLIVFFGLVACITLFSLPRKSPLAIHNRPLHAWIRDLRSEDYQVRTLARSAILELGEQAVPELRKQLYSQALPLQNSLERSVVKWSSRPVEWPRPTLMRQRVLPILADLRSRGSAALPAVVQNLVYPDSTVTLEAERVLRRAGPAAVTELLRGLDSRDSRLRLACARVLKDCADGDARVPAALRPLAQHDPIPAVRAAAVSTLADFGLVDSRIQADLCAGLRDDSAEVRIAAAQGLAELRAVAPETLGALRDALGDRARPVQFHAARAMWRLARDEKPILDVLIQCLTDREVGWQAAYLLGEMKTRQPAAIAALIEALQRERVPRPLRSAPSTAFALGQIGEAAVPALLPMLAHPDPRIRTSAVLALGLMGSQARSSTTPLLPLLRDKDGDVRQATALSLAAIGTANQQALPVLREMLHAEDIYVRTDAASALRKIDPSTDWQIASE